MGYGLRMGLWVVDGVMGCGRGYGLRTGLRVADGVTGCGRGYGLRAGLRVAGGVRGLHVETCNCTSLHATKPPPNATKPSPNATKPSPHTLVQRSFILNESFCHFNGLLSMYRRMAFNALSFRIIIS